MNKLEKRIQKPWSDQTKLEKGWTVFLYVAGLALIVACIVGVVSAWNQDSADQAQADATSGVQALTPSPTPTFIHQITDIVTHHKSDDGYSTLWGVITGAEKTGNAYRVDVTQKDGGGKSQDDNEIQQSVYVVLDALYNNNSIHPDQVTVRVFGPVTDKYGNTSNGQWAVAALTKRTELRFNWKGLDYASAWQVYDQAEYLVNGL